MVLAFSDAQPVTVFTPRQVQPMVDPDTAFSAALDAPEGCARLEDMPEPASVAIAVPDETRPFPVKRLLPLLLARIFKAFPLLPHDRVRIVVGGGLHEPPDADQLGRILPEDRMGCTVVAHDAARSSMCRLGVTSRGTPVEINAAYANADLKIVMGMVDVHQFAGFTGGAKGAVVGCASAEMIAHNHSMLQQTGAFAGNLDGNPVREDLNEAGRIAGVKLAINVALTADKNIAALFVGDPERVLVGVARKTRNLYGLELDGTYDVVVASCGGGPKDICLYQAQKALDAARRCAGAHGRILLVAACAQGIGDERYEDYVRRFSSQEAVLRDFAQRQFQMGAHKAFLFARVAATHELVVHTELPKEAMARCLLRKGDAQATLDRWLRAAPQARVAILTHANATFFRN